MTRGILAGVIPIFWTFTTLPYSGKREQPTWRSFWGNISFDYLRCYLAHLNCKHDKEIVYLNIFRLDQIKFLCGRFLNTLNQIKVIGCSSWSHFIIIVCFLLCEKLQWVAPFFQHFLEVYSSRRKQLANWSLLRILKIIRHSMLKNFGFKHHYFVLHLGS